MTGGDIDGLLPEGDAGGRIPPAGPGRQVMGATVPSQAKPSFDISVSGVKARAARRKTAQKERNALMRAVRKMTREQVDKPSEPGETRPVPPTALTRLRHRKSSFARMCDRGEVTGEMMRAAVEIDFVYMALTAGLGIGGMRLSPPTPGVPSGMNERAIDAYDRRYRPWARKLALAKKRGGPPVLEVLIDLVIDARAASLIDGERGWRHGFAKHLVRRALLDYATDAGWLPQGDLAAFDRDAGEAGRRC